MESSLQAGCVSTKPGKPGLQTSWLYCMLNAVVVDTTLEGPIIGGAQTFLSDLAAGLVSRGVTVSIVTSGEIQERIAAPLLRSGAVIHKNLWPSPALVEDITPVFARWVNGRNPDV